MFENIKKLWKDNVQPEEKPKGQATIIDMNEPIDLFPEHKENL